MTLPSIPPLSIDIFCEGVSKFAATDIELQKFVSEYGDVPELFQLVSRRIGHLVANHDEANHNAFLYIGDRVMTDREFHSRLVTSITNDNLYGRLLEEMTARR